MSSCQMGISLHECQMCLWSLHWRRREVDRITTRIPLATWYGKALPVVAPVPPGDHASGLMTRVTAAERTLSFPKTPVLCTRLHLKHLLRNPVLLFASCPMSWFALTNMGIKVCVLFFLKSIAFKCCFKLESDFQTCCYLCLWLREEQSCLV